MTVASASSSTPSSQRLLDQVRPALLGFGAAAGLQDRVVLGRARRLDHVLGVPARRLRQRSRSHTNRERHRELIPYVVAVISATEMFFIFLMVMHNNPFATFLRSGAGRREGVESASPELLHGDPSAIALHRLRRDDDSVRVRDRGADHRASRRLVAARGAPLDDDRLAVPVVRPDARDAVGVRGARAGAASGDGIRSRTPDCCPGSPRPHSSTR